MPRLSPILLAAALVLGSCQSRRGMYGGFVPPVPLVTVDSVTETKDSPGRGYPLAVPLPSFPFDLRRAGITGSVVVRARVDKDGVVQHVSIVSSTQKEFEQPTLDAVAKWKFVEILDPDQKAHRGMIVDCRIHFGFDEE